MNRTTIVKMGMEGSLSHFKNINKKYKREVNAVIAGSGVMTKVSETKLSVEICGDFLAPQSLLPGVSCLEFYSTLYMF